MYPTRLFFLIALSLGAAIGINPMISMPAIAKPSSLEDSKSQEVTSSDQPEPSESVNGQPDPTEAQANDPAQVDDPALESSLSDPQEAIATDMPSQAPDPTVSAEDAAETDSTEDISQQLEPTDQSQDLEQLGEPDRPDASEELDADEQIEDSEAVTEDEPENELETLDATPEVEAESDEDPDAAAEEVDDRSEPEAIDEEQAEDSRPDDELQLRGDTEQFESVDDTLIPVPEYLNPEPNPLQYPTLPEEVDLVGTQPITLDQAIELARRNNTDLREVTLQLEQSYAALREAQAANLPTVDASTSLVRQDVDDAAPPPTDFLGEPLPEPDTINTNLGASLEVNYDVYTSGRRSALIEAAEKVIRFQELQVEVIEEQLIFDVTSAYYDLQEADEFVRIDQRTLEEAQQSLRDAEALERAGVGTRFAVLQAEVDLANAEQELIQSLSEQQTSRRRMADLINTPQSVNIRAADPVEVAAVWNPSLEDTIVLAFQNRAELEQQLIQREISDAQRRAALAVLGPQVSVFASYNMNDLLDETDTASDRETYAIGIQASIRLFDGGAARAAARQEEINIEIAENAFTDVRNSIRLQVEEAYFSLSANFENIQTASLAVETAEESLRLARLRFQAGVGTQTDVLQAQTDLTRAEVNLLQAVINYNRSLAALNRAVSNTPSNDLSDRPYADD